MTNWKNIRLVYLREIRDQLRDRRTLFTIAVLPLMLYPLMGMALMQVAQFMKEEPIKVWVLGSEQLSSELALVNDKGFSSNWCDEQDLRLLKVVHPDFDELNSVDQLQLDEPMIRQFLQAQMNTQSGEKSKERLQSLLEKTGIDVLLVIPVDFASRAGLPGPDKSGVDIQQYPHSDAGMTDISIVMSSSREKSALGAEKINQIVRRWRAEIVKQNLESAGIERKSYEPFMIRTSDVASSSGKKAAMWSKVLPFVLMIWALTGAFYPAIDLVAGEKERGTLETLLTSPAKRVELVIGKMLTVMSFSMCTSLLNLASMGFTGLFVMGQLSSMSGASHAFELGTPPLVALGWLLLGLIPISATFSALALAVASFAKSSKEGQYYLVPLLIMTLPLMMLSMMPGTELDLGMSFVPVTGMMLLLKGLIEGQLIESARFAAPVVMVSCVGCWLSIRWAVHQFKSESVLFRESERFGIGVWIKHLMRERGPFPTVGEAILCGLIILMVKFFISFAAQVPNGFGMFAQQTVIVLVAAIAVPAVLMAMVLTRSPRQTLKLTLPKWWTMPAAFCIALLLHPAMMSLTQIVMQIYPPSENLAALQGVVDRILGSAPNMFAILAVMALAPAITEELAFRGFILSGLEKLNTKWGAICVTSLLFAAAHGVIQQSMMAFVTGSLIGIVAIQTRSIFPCIIYHATHNGASVLMSQVNEATLAKSSILRWVFDAQTIDGTLVVQYASAPALLMTLGGIILMTSLFRLKLPRIASTPAISSKTVPV